ncbi:MAG: hypothetical protein ABEJ06_06900 [Haloarculaceae archaeon]
MTWIDDFLGTVNRKCDNCGRLISDEPHAELDDAELCSAWCLSYYREHRR